MIDIYDSEAIVKIYRLLNKKCEALDKFINDHAFYFGPTSAEYSSQDVCNHIIQLMERKNRLINLKLIVDQAIRTLNEKDKKILLIKLNYNITLGEICEVLNLQERTAFRRIERAYEDLAEALNNSKHAKKLEKILRSEQWIENVKSMVEARRLSYRNACSNSL